MAKTPGRKPRLIVLDNKLQRFAFGELIPDVMDFNADNVTGEPVVARMVGPFGKEGSIDFQRKGDVIELTQILIPQESQRQGRGKEALAKLVDYARDEGVKKIVSYPIQNERTLYYFLKGNGFTDKGLNNEGNFYTMEMDLEKASES